MTIEVDPVQVPTVPVATESKKSPSEKNALKHGLYSKDVVLPWEDQEEFDELHREYREEFNPEGAFEEDLVGQIVRQQWLKGRLWRHHHQRFTSDPIAEDLESLATKGSSAIEDYMRTGIAASQEELERKRPAFSGTFPELRRFIDRSDKIYEDLKAEQAKGDKPTEENAAQSEPAANGPGDADTELRDKALRSRARQIAKDEADPTGSIKKPVDRFVEQTEGLRASQVLLDRLYRPQDAADLIRSLNSIDASIQKAMGRLVNMKEYKLRYGKQTVLADPSKQV